MNKYKLPLTAFFIAFAANASSFEDASTSNTKASNTRVSIEWVEPKSFRDVRDSNMSTQKYRERVFADLHEYFNELAEQLPDGQTLKLKVTDLDMAGSVQQPSMVGLGNASLDSRYHANELRIVRQIDIPRIDLSYELLDKDGKVLKKEDVNLKDMNFMSRVSSISKNTSLRYEKIMISRWFNETFLGES